MRNFPSDNALTVGELKEQLSQFDDALPIAMEGCDCDLSVGAVEVVNADQHNYFPMRTHVFLRNTDSFDNDRSQS